ncbi:hypothetical protein QUH42_11060, partial [Klebsiella grimontii]
IHLSKRFCYFIHHYNEKLISLSREKRNGASAYFGQSVLLIKTRRLQAFFRRKSTKSSAPPQVNRPVIIRDSLFTKVADPALSRSPPVRARFLESRQLSSWRKI